MRNRCCSTDLGNVTLQFRTAKGCPQGGVLSPLLWNIVVDSGIALMEERGFDVQCFADDMVIVARGKFREIVLNLAQQALDLEERWAYSNGLSLNPRKTKIMNFTRRWSLKRGIPKLKLIDMNRVNN